MGFDMWRIVPKEQRERKQKVSFKVIKSQCYVLVGLKNVKALKSG